MTDHSQSKEEAGGLVKAIGELVLHVEMFAGSVKSRRLPVVAVGVSNLFLIFLACYCNSREIPFFDFMQATGVYAYVFALMAAFFYGILVAYYCVPVAARIELQKIMPNKLFVNMLIFGPPFVVWLTVVAFSVGKLRALAFLLDATAVLVSVVALITFKFANKNAKPWYLVYTSNAMVLPQALISSLVGIFLLEAFAGKDVEVGTYAEYALYVIVFILIPVLPVILASAVPTPKNVKNLAVGAAFFVAIPLTVGASFSMDRMLRFFNVGGDQKIVIQFRADAVPEFDLAMAESAEQKNTVRTVAESQPVRLRFITSDYAYIIKNNKDNHGGVVMVNLSYVTNIRACTDQSYSPKC